MKVSLKRRLNIFSKLRRWLASVKWVLLLIMTAMLFLSACDPQQTLSQILQELGGASTGPAAIVAPPPEAPPAVAPPITGGAPSPVVNTSPVSASPPGITKIVLPGSGSPTVGGVGGGSAVAQPNKPKANNQGKKANNQGNNQGKKANNQGKKANNQGKKANNQGNNQGGQ